MTQTERSWEVFGSLLLSVLMAHQLYQHHLHPSAAPHGAPVDTRGAFHLPRVMSLGDGNDGMFESTAFRSQVGKKARRAPPMLLLAPLANTSANVHDQLYIITIYIWFFQASSCRRLPFVSKGQTLLPLFCRSHAVSTWGSLMCHSLNHMSVFTLRSLKEWGSCGSSPLSSFRVGQRGSEPQIDGDGLSFTSRVDPISRGFCSVVDLSCSRWNLSSPL